MYSEVKITGMVYSVIYQMTWVNSQIPCFNVLFCFY